MMDNRILVVDDEKDFLESARRGLVMAGFRNVVTETDPEKAAHDFQKGEPFDIALVDITMPGLSGVELLEIIKNTSPNTECIMITAHNEARIAVECMKKGAYDYQVKPITRDDLIPTIHRALERKRLLDILGLEKKKGAPKLTHEAAFRPIVTRSAKLQRIMKEAELHAGSDMPVLITGESGTGKELLARLIHNAGPRKTKAMITLNCAALPETLMESELFGYEKGAFTGAAERKTGKIELADGGTLFLDEIGEMSPGMQAKLLRVLQEGLFYRVGGNEPISVDIRIISATNRDIEEDVGSGKFREDLYYRMNVVQMRVPPLRERKEDIPLIAQHYLNLFKSERGLPDLTISKSAMNRMLQYDWPGNIRELRNAVERAVVMGNDREIVPEDLPISTARSGSTGMTVGLTLKEAMDQFKKEFLIENLKRTGGNRARAAKTLGIQRTYLSRLVTRYGIRDV